MIKPATMKPSAFISSLLALSLILSSTGWASDSTGLQCKYRDGWYIPHLVDISCLETGCDFVIRTRQSPVDAGKISSIRKADSQDSRNGLEISLSTGQTLQLERTWANRYEGNVFFGNGSFAYHEKIHCRSVSR